jgi:hypothetical protein
LAPDLHRELYISGTGYATAAGLGWCLANCMLRLAFMDLTIAEGVDRAQPA